MKDLLKRNNITIQGNGSKIMLFVHGFGCDQNMWRFITPSFKDDYKIILIDLVGSGKSDVGAYNYEKYSTLDGYADDIIEICEALDLKKLIFVGHSVSAMIGVLASIKKPSAFEHLILVGPSARYINDENYYGGFSTEAIDELLQTLDSNYLGWSSAMAPVIMGNPDRPELASELENSFCQNDPAVAKHFAKVTFLGDNRGDLTKVQVNTLILQSKTDIIASTEVGKYVHQQIEGSKLVVLETTGHCPHMSDPIAVSNAMKEYLSR